MPTGIPFGLCGPTYTSRGPLWIFERAINWYPAVDESKHAKSPVALAPTPGITPFATLVNPPVRGLWAGDERLFAVGGADLCEISSGGTVTVRGSVTNAQTPVQFASNGDSLLVASGDQIYIDTGTTVPPHTGPVFRAYDGAISCVYLDGYYIILWKDSNTIQISNDGITWDPLDIQNKMGSIDRLVRLEAFEGHLWLFGKRTIDVWYNSGNADFPFERISGSFIDQGTMAPWSVAQIDKTLYWLGSDERGRGRVFRSQGFTPVRISNPAIEFLIEAYLNVGVDQTITGSGYTEDGHTFYVLSFPLANATLVYDLTTDMWHERLRWDGSGWVQWRGSGFHAFVFGKHLVARMSGLPFDATSYKIYEQSVQIASDDGLPIRRFRATPYVTKDQQWLFHHYLRLYTDAPSTGFSMRYQKDDGTWSTPRTVAPLRHEVKYRRLGRARDRMYEVWALDGTNRPAVIEAYLHASPGVDR